MRVVLPRPFDKTTIAAPQRYFTHDLFGIYTVFLSMRVNWIPINLFWAWVSSLVDPDLNFSSLQWVGFLSLFLGSCLFYYLKKMFSCRGLSDCCRLKLVVSLFLVLHMVPPIRLYFPPPFPISRTDPIHYNLSLRLCSSSRSLQNSSRWRVLLE